jgi:hypothetical protein
MIEASMSDEEENKFNLEEGDQTPLMARKLQQRRNQERDDITIVHTPHRWKEVGKAGQGYTASAPD